MIDADYHQGVAMRVEPATPFHAVERPEKGQRPADTWPEGVRRLLDHLAEELALEYVRLMERAAGAPGATSNDGVGEGE
jgi:hypothetical protein